MCGEGLVSAAACWEEQRPASVAGGEERGQWDEPPRGRDGQQVGVVACGLCSGHRSHVFVQGFHALGGRFVSGGKGMCHGIKPSVVLHAKTGVLHNALQHG